MTSPRKISAELPNISAVHLTNYKYTMLRRNTKGNNPPDLRLIPTSNQRAIRRFVAYAPRPQNGKMMQIEVKIGL
jgi:hypothetical protein